MGTGVLLAAMMAGGCQRTIEEGIGVFQEGAGDYRTVQQPTRTLTDFNNIEIGEFDVAYEPTPESLLPIMKAELRDQLRSKNQPINSGGSPTLLIRGTVIYYEESTKMSNQVFGPHEEAVAEVEFVDRDSGQVIARATCVGRTNSSVAQGVETKGDGLGEAIAKWIDRYRPVPKQRED